MSINWSSNGNLLATGCDDGIVRLWTIKGELKFFHSYHKNTVLGVHFNQNDTYLISCSKDFTVISLKILTNETQIYKYHDSSVLDVDWFNETTFASCSEDGSIAIWKIGDIKPINILTGHNSAVNKILWDPSKKYLASCSDDSTIRIWYVFEKNSSFVLIGHTKGVYSIKWTPKIHGQKYLLSCSFDNNIRLWDIPNKTCLYVINKHISDVYALSFSINGEYFASGGSDNHLYIFRTSDGLLISSIETPNLYDISWNPKNLNISFCGGSSNIGILKISQINFP